LKPILVIASAIVATTMSPEIDNSKLRDHGVCEIIKVSLRNNLDTIIRIEMINFQLKKDVNYVTKYSAYYDEALSNYDIKALKRAIESVSYSCPL